MNRYSDLHVAAQHTVCDLVWSPLPQDEEQEKVKAERVAAYEQRKSKS